MSYVMQPIEITGTTTLDRDSHANGIVVHNAAGGGTITLPASTGKGDTYEIVVHTTVTSSLIIAVDNATDEFRGGVSISTDIAGVTFLVNDNDDTLTMNGSTTGGLSGSRARFTDYKAGFWNVEGFLVSTGTETDPFSAAVS